MRWRCLKDYFGYCKGKPQFIKEPEDDGTHGYIGGKCKADPATCGQYSKTSPTEEESNEIPSPVLQSYD